jgi:glycosyltransferase involved in cell wall biosynthesis
MADASVVVTCFNLERYIGAAIESVLAQDFDDAIQIIVVDDCSTDGSAAVIRSFPAVQYLRMPVNGGVLQATLAGIQATSSDLVLFLDGDDLWEPGKLPTVLSRFAADPSLGLATHDLRYIDAEGVPLDRPSRPQAALGSLTTDEQRARVRQGILHIDDYVWLGSALAIRKSVIDLAGFMVFARALPDPANTYQDWPLAYWIAAQAEVGLEYIPEKLFRYRLHEANHSGDARTPARAVRNLTRAINTNLAIADIARMRNLSPRLRRIVEARIRLNCYLVELNGGHRLRALMGLIKNAPDLRRRRLLLKEVARYLGVQLLGPRRFAALVSRRRILRNLPVT